MIEIIGGKLWQWDTGRTVKITQPQGENVCEVHFDNGTTDNALVGVVKIEDGIITSEIPNILLQSSNNLTIYSVSVDESGKRTEESLTVSVTARPKPDDYVYTETEVRTWEALKSEIHDAVDNLNKEMSKFTEKFVQEGYKIYSNALIADKSEKIVRINDVSSLQKNIEARLTSDTITNFDGVKVKIRGKNLIPEKYYSKTMTDNGIAFTLNEDGTVHAQGVATGNAVFYINLTSVSGSTLFRAGAYFVSGCPSGGAATKYHFNVRAQDQTKTFNDVGNGALMNLTEDTNIVLLLRVNKGTDISQGITFKPQIELGYYATEYEKPVAAVDCYAEPNGEFYNFTVGEDATIEIDNPETTFNVKYVRDINKAFADLQNIALRAMNG